jgi:lysophospholipase L1-like esterase
VLIGAVYAGYVVSTREEPAPLFAEAVQPYVAEPDPVAAFLGDSYTSGTGAAVGRSYGPITSRLMCWAFAPFGEGGTGYANPGDAPGESVYADRVPQVVAASPDVVIVQGSTNDYENDEAYAGAVRTFSALRAGLRPDVPIVAIGPIQTPDSRDELVAAASSGVARAAAENGVRFIDPVAEQWVPKDPTYFADGVHPNDRGHEMFATRAAEDLRSMDAAAFTSC